MDVSEKSKSQSIPWLIALVGIGLYAANLGDYFRSDDFVTIAGLEQGSALSLFTGENLAGSTFYRPLTLFSFWADKSVWNLNPLGYHLSNMLLFGAALLLFYALLSTLFSNSFIPVLATIIMAIHPANADCVAWASGRTELLCAIFMLAAILSFIKFRCRESGSWHLYILALLFSVLALMSKENAIMLPMLVLIADLFCEKDMPRKQDFLLYLPWLLIIVPGYLAIRTSVLGGIGGYGAIHLQFGLFVFRNLIGYIQYFIVPIDFSSHASFFILHQSLIIPAIAITITAVAVLFRKQLFSKAGLFGIAFALFAFLPIGNLFPQNWQAFTLHFGFSLLSAVLIISGLNKTGLLRKLSIAFFACWLIVLLVFSVRASMIARTASQLSKKSVTQIAEITDLVTDPVNILALTVPDTYKGVFVLRNGLHQAVHLARPHRKLVAHRLSLVGLYDVMTPGIKIIKHSAVRFEIHLQEGCKEYILLPDGIWSRHKGETAIIGPVGYRITDEQRLFCVNGLEMNIDESFIDRPGTILVAFKDGSMTTDFLEED